MSGSWPTPTDWSCRGSPRRPRAVSRPQGSLAKPTCRPVRTSLRWSASCQRWRARGSRRQQPCCGDHGHHLLCTREAYKRECLSPLYEEATSALYADSGNTGSSECQLLDFQQRRRPLEPGILAHWIEPRPEPVRVRVPCRAFLSCLFIAVGG